MNEEEKKLQDQKVLEEAAKAELDPIASRDEEIAKLKEERDNYKTVALKRLGKLPGDAEFFDKDKSESGLTTEEIVKQTLLEREIARKEQEKEADYKRMARENAELKLALKNRPGSGTIGNDAGASADVKDNVFSPSQIEALTAKAKRLKVDPAKFIEKAKANFTSRR